VTIPHLDAAEVRRRLSPLAAVDALEAALRSGVEPEEESPRSVVDVPGGHLLVMPSAAAPHPVVKVVSVGGEPRVQGVCLAFDGGSLSPAALLDGIAITNLRTAAVSALAVRRLAVPDARRLLVFGRGPQAMAHIEAIRAVRPIARVDTLGRDAAERDALVAAADIICCCTTAREPLFDGARVADHATVVAIGSHEPEAREVDDALVARSTVVVESTASALREAGDVILAIRAGALDPGRLIPLRELVCGERSPSPDAPRLFKSTGMAWEDAVTVDAVLSR
jgi:ornithine cyclodeaminase